MKKIISVPGKYIQSKNILNDLCSYVEKYGKKILLLTSKEGKKRVMPRIRTEGNDVEFVYEIFSGECSFEEIKRIQETCLREECEAIVGAGGGKLLDTAKAVAAGSELPVVIVPTSASTDAPCSSLSVVYANDGTIADCLYFEKNPDLVLVDTDLIRKAPARLLASGMGDALATWFEARACNETKGLNSLGGRPTVAAMAMARACFDILMRDGIQALNDVKNGTCSEAVENIIEANTYLSGIGFESGGLAAAHAVHNGLIVIEATHKWYHGEKVAFGTLVQLVLENTPAEQLEQIFKFCVEAKLPVTLEQLGVTDPEELRKVAEAVMENEIIHNMAVEVSADILFDAMQKTSQMGKTYLI